MSSRVRAGALATLTALLAGACAAGATGPAASPISATFGPESPVVGVITHVESTGISSVTAFQVRDGTGTIFTFRIGQLENGDQFPPGHLTEHQATSDPVRVFFRREGGELVAYRIEDASR